MVVVYKLSKATHFISVKSTHKAVNIVDIFMKEIFRLHRVPKVIIWNRDVTFTGKFWKGLFKGLGTKLNFNIAYHPQNDGKTERVNQIMEDICRMHIMDKQGK